ncbi:DUF2059 domain-containing protein [Ruegeria sp. HKCCD7255]|uniref:DUF2059 domain-containing protein n=1 Tax=Ruegeria sp. HKCCD7255 TaxID=2683004 RepID=UPI00148A1167|nr:DUF2059 domain-containing protein [Ruegeria sp. HKCCD7255]
MRLVALLIAALLCAGPLAASDNLERLAKAMHLADVAEILRTEGLEQGKDLNETLLNGRAGQYYEEQIDLLFDETRLHDQIASALDRKMTDAQIEKAAIFFESELGQSIVTLENAARRAFWDEQIEDYAIASYRDADRDSPFYRLIEEYIRLNNLIELNVQGSMSAHYNFYLGLSEGRDSFASSDSFLLGLLDDEVSKAETTEWLFSFLLMAYRPLSEAELRENIAFSRTETGRALNRALFAGFDDIFDGIWYQLGTAVSKEINASDL